MSSVWKKNVCSAAVFLSAESISTTSPGTPAREGLPEDPLAVSCSKRERALVTGNCCQTAQHTHGVKPVATKRIRRPTCAAIAMNSDCHTACNDSESHKFEKKRPTLRFSEMIRHDWTTFSREKAGSFDYVELAVYSPWRELDLTPSQLDHFGISSDAVYGQSMATETPKNKKSSWMPRRHKMYHGQLTPASMRVLFDALRFVSQACEILRSLEQKDQPAIGRQILSASALFWTITVHSLRWKLESNSEYQKPPRSKSQKGSYADDVKELQVRVKLDHPVLEPDHWSRLLGDMKKVRGVTTLPSNNEHFPTDIGLDQSRMLVIQAAVLCTSFMLHLSDIAGEAHGKWSPLKIPRHACEEDICIDIRSLVHVVMAIGSRPEGSHELSVLGWTKLE